MGQIWQWNALREEARVVSANGVALARSWAEGDGDGREGDFEFFEDRFGVTGEGVLVRVTGGLRRQRQTGHDFGGLAVASLDHPNGAGIATLADLTIGGAVVGIETDFKATDLFFAGGSAVVYLGDGENATDDAVGDAGGTTAFDNLLAGVQLR